MGKFLRIPVEKYPADWTRYGYAAGPIRNQQMLDEGRPSLVLAFHNDFEHSKGTKDMIDKARKANIPAILYSERGEENRWPVTERMF